MEAPMFEFELSHGRQRTGREKRGLHGYVANGKGAGASYEQLYRYLLVGQRILGIFATCNCRNDSLLLL